MNDLLVMNVLDSFEDLMEVVPYLNLAELLPSLHNLVQSLNRLSSTLLLQSSSRK